MQQCAFQFQSSMSKRSDLSDILWGKVHTIGAFLLVLLAVVAIAALFGLFVVVMRLPIDLYRTQFFEGNSD